MTISGKTLAFMLSGAFTLASAGCSGLSGTHAGANPIVGTWLVKDPNAPFPYHLYVFNADGNMQQANPDAGDPRSSDSDGKGVWVADGDRIKGKWVEVMADRVTRQFTGRLEVTYDIKVTGDTYAGTETVRSYDANGVMTQESTASGQLAGERVKLP